jgi:hypothetical protein
MSSQFCVLPVLRIGEDDVAKRCEDEIVRPRRRFARQIDGDVADRAFLRHPLQAARDLRLDDLGAAASSRREPAIIVDIESAVRT